MSVLKIKIIALTFVLILPACAARVRPILAQELLILYSNNVNGEMEPCG